MLFNRVYSKKAAVFIIFMSAILILASCSIKKKGHSRSNVSITGNVQETESQVLTGVIVNVDRELGQVTVRELDYDVDTILDYNAASEIIWCTDNRG